MSTRVPLHSYSNATVALYMAHSNDVQNHILQERVVNYGVTSIVVR